MIFNGIDGISTSRTLSDMDSILYREEELYSAKIEINQKLHVRRLAHERIIREVEDYEKGLCYNQNLVHELVCETSRLSNGQVYNEESDTLMR